MEGGGGGGGDQAQVPLHQPHWGQPHGHPAAGGQEEGDLPALLPGGARHQTGQLRKNIDELQASHVFGAGKTNNYITDISVIYFSVLFSMSQYVMI